MIDDKIYHTMLINIPEREREREREKDIPEL